MRRTDMLGEMGRIVPLLPPLAVIALVIGASADGWLRHDDLRIGLAGLPLLVICAVYVRFGKRAASR